MIAALALGSGAALIWAGGALVNTNAVRNAGALHTLAWTTIVGTVTALLAALAGGGSPAGWTEEWGYLLVAGVATAAGSGFTLLALSAGRVGIVLPIVACDGAIGAGLATLAGATLPATAAIALGAMAVGIVLLSSTGGSEPIEQAIRPSATHRTATTALLAALAATSYGIVFFAGGQASEMDPLWAVAFTRIAMVSCAAPFLLRPSAPARPGPMWPWLLVSGVAEVTAYALFVVAAGHQPMVAAVAASQYGALSALAGFLVFRERMRPIQVLGLAVLVVSVGALAAVGL